MPWLGQTSHDSPPTQKWHTVLQHAFLRRITVERLSEPLKSLTRQYPTTSGDIANVLVSFRASQNGSDDPLWFHYAQACLLAGYMTTADFLVVLLEYSIFSSKPDIVHPVGNKHSLPTCEERTFTMLAQLFSTNALEVKHQSAHNLIFALTRWQHAIHDYETAKQLEPTGLYTVDGPSFGMYEALTSLVLVVFRSKGIRTVTQLSWWKLRRPNIVEEMNNFDLHILQWMHSQLRTQLQGLTKMPPFVETDTDGRPILTSQDVLDSVVEIPTVRSRAGVYVWLNACLCGRPMTDDQAMQGYLQARYATDYQSMAVDLLTASFDVLTNAMIRREPRQSIKVIRSFICNKLPLWLSLLAGFVATSGMSMESCIQVAFMSSITEDILPPISAGANDVREVLKQTRLEFLQACALHHLVTESTVAQILHEPSIALPRVTKYTREGLVAQCSHNVGRLEGLVDEIQGMQGNAGAVAGCVVQVITNLCVSKDTMSLKAVCHTLIKRIPDMDIVMQHARPASILFPLCQLLNEWVHDQDQTEFTPAYEEFAAILMLVLAVVYRYDLDVAEIGITVPDTFVERLAKQRATSRPLSELTAEQAAQLGKWLEGLYTTDEHGEASGIGDDVMRQCPPQDFYLLVPTLFEQSVAACRSGVLPIATFKVGLELLLEPFLLPSLVCGLGWLVKHSWEDHGDVDILLQVLDKLLKPSSASQETQAMHRAILVIVSPSLVRSLQDLQRRNPEKREVAGLIALLQQYDNQQRVSRHSDKAAMAEATPLGDGKTAQVLRERVHQLVMWASSIGPIPPPKYSHTTFVSSTNVMGPERVLESLIAELRSTPANASAIALDVCVSMICAPTSASQPSPLNTATSGRASQVTLRDCLTTWMSDTSRVLTMPAAEAQALIRLSRGVEVQSAMPQITQVPIAIQPQESTDQVLQDLGLTDPDISGAVAGDQNITMDQTSFSDADLNSALGQSVNLVEASAQDLSGLASDGSAMQVDQGQNLFDDLGLGMDMGQQPQQTSNLDLMGDNMFGNTDNGQSVQEDDIFAGLDMGNMGDDFVDFN